MFFHDKTSNVCNFRCKYRRQFMLTTAVNMEHNQSTITAINHQQAIYGSNFMTILDFFISHRNS